MRKFTKYAAYILIGLVVLTAYLAFVVGLYGLLLGPWVLASAGVGFVLDYYDYPTISQWLAQGLVHTVYIAVFTVLGRSFWQFAFPTERATVQPVKSSA